MATYTPGPGDEETWGPYAGHPNDPRAPEPEEDEPWVCPHCFQEDDVSTHECEGVRAAMWSAMSKSPTARLDATIKTLTNPRSKKRG